VVKFEASTSPTGIPTSETTKISIDNSFQSTDNSAKATHYPQQPIGGIRAPVINITAPSDEQPASSVPETARGRSRGRSRASRGASSSRSLPIAGAKGRTNSTKARGKSRSLSVNNRISKLTLREPKVCKGRGLKTWPTCVICHSKTEFDADKGQILSCPIGCEGGME
jgi:hypothetical protein